MMQLAPEAKIYLSLQPADMRKSIDGLCGLAESVLEQEPTSGHLFLFVSRDRPSARKMPHQCCRN